MNRRELLQRAALTLGYAISAPAAAAILNGCKAKSELAYVPTFFSEDQARLLSALCETIIPRTDTPGAIDANVPGFIDDLVGTVYTPKQQKAIIDGLDAFGAEAKTAMGDDFTELSPEKQLEYVKKKNEEALADGGSAGSEGWWAAGSGKPRPFFLDIKELTLLGFFTSEPGATKVLQYNQVPGPFKGCVPLAEVGKTWAT
jgi:gluconate 2-dehydrogenase gamma chain